MNCVNIFLFILGLCSTIQMSTNVQCFVFAHFQVSYFIVLMLAIFLMHVTF